MVNVDEVIGLLPAGGRGTRVDPLPCSKELFPIGFRKINGQNEMRPKVVSHYLLEKMRIAGIRKAYFVLRQGKWDIPAYFGDGKMLDMDVAYLIMRVPHGPPYTLDQAYPFVRDKMIAFGFPDILFEGDDAFVELLDRQTTTEADVVLGLFPVKDPWTMDMVDVENGAVRSIVIKPEVTNLRWGWIMAVWTPVFTEFLHDYVVTLLQGRSGTAETDEMPELSVGQVFRAALGSGLKLQSVQFPERAYLDIGTPDNLVKAVHEKKFINHDLG